MHQTQYITVSDLEIKYKQKSIFSGLNFGVPTNARIGLVGINGAGKTTLLKALAGTLEIDGGSIQRTSGLKITYLPQELSKQLLQLTAHEYLYPKIEHETDEYLKVLEKIESLKNIFQIPDDSRLLKDLSGGQLRQLSLVKALASSPDLLMLDEPTNHLDLKTTLKLRDLLLDFPGTVILISHDRYFIDQVATSIWELEGGRLFVHAGNYSDYLNSKENRYQSDLITFERTRRELAREHEWFIAGVKARGTKDEGRMTRYFTLKNLVKNSKPKWSKAFLPIPAPQHLGNKILRLINLSVRTPDDSRYAVQDLNLDLSKGAKIGILGANGSGKTTLINAIMGLGQIEKGKIVVGKNTVFNFQDQSRLGIDTEKSIWFNVSQNQLKFPFGDKIVNIYAYLRQFLFDPKGIKEPAGTLSGGQKARLLLAKILKNGGNFLVLDEPTNDLDLDSLEALENSLTEFKGCLLIVSHDRFFLDRVCTNILALQGNGKYIFSTGGYTEYIEKYRNGDEENPFDSNLQSSISENLTASLEQQPEATNFAEITGEIQGELENLGLVDFDEISSLLTAKANSEQKNKENQDLKKDTLINSKEGLSNQNTDQTKTLSSKLNRKYKAQMRKIEMQTLELEKEIYRLETQSSKPDFYAKGQDYVIKMGKLLVEKKQELQELENQWLELADGVRG